METRTSLLSFQCVQYYIYQPFLLGVLQGLQITQTLPFLSLELSPLPLLSINSFLPVLLQLPHWFQSHLSNKSNITLFPFGVSFCAIKRMKHTLLDIFLLSNWPFHRFDGGVRGSICDGKRNFCLVYLSIYLQRLDLNRIFFFFFSKQHLFKEVVFMNFVIQQKHALSSTFICSLYHIC